MKTVYFKNKKANHSVNVKGKNIAFKDGKAQIEDEEAAKLAKKPEYSLKAFMAPKKKGKKKK